MNRVFFSSVGFGATGGGVFRPGHRHHGGGQGAHEEAGRLQVVPGGRRPGARRHGRPQERSQPVRPAVPHAGLRRPLNPREKPFSFLFFFPVGSVVSLSFSATIFWVLPSGYLRWR